MRRRQERLGANELTVLRAYLPAIEAAYGTAIDEWIEALRPHAGETPTQQLTVLKNRGMSYGYAHALVHVFREEHGGG